MARKYEEVRGYWVYSIQIPSINKYYIGVSKLKCCQRWQKSLYKGMALSQYLDEWDLMGKKVLIDGLSSKKEALIYEDALIQSLKMNDLCINERRSGLIKVSDVNAYNKEKHKQRYKNDAEFREHRKQQAKQYRENNKERERERHKQYREDNKEKIREHYEDNKEKYNETRRQQYKNDAEFREHRKQQAKQYYENNKEKINENRKQRRLKMKLEKQQQHTVVN